MTLCLNALGREEDVDLLHDRGFLVGDGVYETLRVESGAALWIEEHHGRLADSAHKVRLPCPWSSTEVVAFLRKSLPSGGLARLRLTLTAGAGGRGFIRPDPVSPRLYVTCTPVQVQPPLENLGVAPGRVPLSWPAKTLSSLPRILEAPPAGSEWVMVNEGGLVTEATMANVFWWREGSWHTPAPSASLLLGLTRGRVLELMRQLGIPVREEDYPLDEFRKAEEVFLTGTVAGVVNVRQLEGRPLRASETEKIRTEYDLLIKNEVARAKMAFFS